MLRHHRQGFPILFGKVPGIKFGEGVGAYVTLFLLLARSQVQPQDLKRLRGAFYPYNVIDETGAMDLPKVTRR